ncbi:hypothetical protein NP233_g5157 [Leucocoprinus birnbaumii]|uniref:6-phosphogluconate dehydrogenase, decarboxylating n=1 Tax=Leucocoprinus birnbaumii TaxID=56174 RepID=A0AAD5VX15_9AGAR|nr:hypothetical protein NP233_g5157 [Leucocoprinus birnbaumii]
MLIDALDLIISGDIGLIGLAVMGQNLILNMNDKGFNVVAYNRTTSKVDHFLENEAKGTNIQGAHSIEELCKKLKRPRKIILLVKAGSAVDDFIKQLIPYLEKGDIIIDGGNSHYPDSIRRTKDCEAQGILFVGSGVSGGEEGARHGPSLMPGGSNEAWPAIKEIFQKTAAQANGEPCCDWVGETGSGHYVKMVHNGIEYGDMQLIAEAYDILKRGLGLKEAEISEIFTKWNKGVLDSFLIEITANILKFNDDDGEPVVSKILDKAGQKGTGKWTAIAALDSGTAVTLIGEAVFARCLSAIKDERSRASKVLPGPVKEPFKGDKQQFIDDLEQALYASKIISYTQGFMLMRETAKELNWNLNYAGIAAMWRGGCIIKSVFLGDITSAYRKNPQLESLLFDDFFKQAVHKAQPGWRRIIAQAVLWGIPTPAFSTALAFFDGYRSEIVPANLLQAQRDYFGAHTFRVLPGKENEKFKAGEDIRPDRQNTIRTVISPLSSGANACEGQDIVLECFASELQLRGNTAVTQPHVQDGTILCWNGEVFDGLEVLENENDGVRLFEELCKIKSDDDLVRVLGTLEGPYAFTFYHAIPVRVNQELPEEDLSEIGSLDTIPEHLQLPVDQLIAELDKSVRLQVQSIPSRIPGEARLAILFSGGIDSTALCYFADRHIPKDEPIDLLNVAFENPRKIRVQQEGNPDALPKHLKRERKKNEPNGRIPRHDTSYLVPDRVGGLEELEELRKVCPNRVWNFVEINVPYEETQKAKPIVEAIMFPSRTVMDLSLALALWFASRGVGIVKEAPEAPPIPYTSTARVLLNGLGSDELLGGYGRHRSAFNSGSWPAVIEEVCHLIFTYTTPSDTQQLQLEIDRIPTRNLGRDDRMVSSHGKETRHPFLSLDVVAFLAKLPIYQKMDPRSKVGLGDKMLLRLAMRKVDLQLASARKKRAMQFGSHSARMEGERRGDTPLE